MKNTTRTDTLEFRPELYLILEKFFILAHKSKAKKKK